MGISKQFVDCGDGVPLIQRTVDQFTKILPGANFFLLIGEDQVKEFAPIKGCHRLLRHHPSDFSLGTEVFGYQASKVLHNSDILLLYGDVYFTDNALRLIKDACITSMEFKAFGRKNKNPENRNNGGEDFGLFMPKERNSFILGWYQLTGDIYNGSRLFRFSPWEVISLISWARKKGIKSAAEFRLTRTTPDYARDGIVQTFNDREFDKNLWVEIDDDTEDFDFPIEYMTRLLLMAERMQ